MEGLKQLIDYGIIGLLIALSLWAVAVAMERWYFFPARGCQPFSKRAGM